MTPPDYENPNAVTKIGFDSNEYEVVVKADSIDEVGNSNSVSHTLIVRCKMKMTILLSFKLRLLSHGMR